MVVFQECLQQFNALPVNAKKCRHLLAELLRLIYHGEVFPAAESTTLFFSILKLFQHRDVALRQIVYLAIKELSATSQDILMVTSSIMKDIQAGESVYKPNAIRTLSKVLDPSTVSALERLFKNSIVEKNPVIASAALISCYNLLPIAKDVVKRFTNETLELLSSQKQFPANQFELHEFYGSATTNLPLTTFMYQYHALGLLYHLRNHDKMALMKLITSVLEGSNTGSSTSLKNSLSIIQLIRYIGKVLTDDESLIRVLYPILSSYLKHKSDMVELEACKILIQVQNLIKDEEFMGIVTCLQKLLSVPRTSTRFAAIRLINKISIKHPEKIIVVNLELENLINDSNRSISTLAITTLLKTMGVGTVANVDGGENVDRLITKMTSLMEDITEDFKIVIIEAIENLALKFPSKHKKLVAFLTDLLRDDGTLGLKSAIIDALFDLIKFLPDQAAKQLILMNLCEFIEDCEFTELSVRILHLLGDEGPYTANPSYYIRHIYNRLVLENSIVRSSAVISLSKFAVVCGGELLSNIQILLSRCLNDVDDEVRDRAALSLRFIANSTKLLVLPESKYNLAVLENKLAHYLNDSSNFQEKFNISEIPLFSNEELKSMEYSRKVNKMEIDNDESGNNDESKNSEPADTNAQDDLSAQLLKQQEYSQELAAIPEFASFGKLTKSSPTPIYLTDKENEYVITVVKHFFVESRKLVLQYNITNTIDHMVLQDISMVAQPDNELYEEEFIIQLDELRPDQTGIVYVAFNTPEFGDEESTAEAAFGNTMTYMHKEIIDEEGNIDPADEGWADDYQIEDLYVLPGDFIFPLYNSNFTAVFDQLEHEDSLVYNLTKSKTLEASLNKIRANLNMMALDGSDYVADDAVSHSLKLLGKDVWGGKVAALVRIALTNGNIVAKVQVKAENKYVVGIVLDGVVY